jgi:hypothetical protein
MNECGQLPVLFDNFIFNLSKSRILIENFLMMINTGREDVLKKTFGNVNFVISGCILPAFNQQTVGIQ